MRLSPHLGFVGVLINPAHAALVFVSRDAQHIPKYSTSKASLLKLFDLSGRTERRKLQRADPKKSRGCQKIIGSTKKHICHIVGTKNKKMLQVSVQSGVFSTADTAPIVPQMCLLESTDPPNRDILRTKNNNNKTRLSTSEPCSCN